MKELPKRYDPKQVEQKWYDLWLKQGLFRVKRDSSKKPFCIVIPPPNVTGILHMGHALNNTYQDILIRFANMKGLQALWMPGIDHAGIATQNVVEKKIALQGQTRQDLGREKFLQKVWEWKQQYGSTIIEQLKRLGSSCDWERLRFTMDDEYSKAVKEVFVRLWNKKLIYQSDKVINWCPRCLTALSDEEAPYSGVKAKLYYIKYPLKDSKKSFITVATTRPETMLGDTAVAVNPKDKRYKKLIGKHLILPLMGRDIPVIGDESIEKDFGTGAVKVTPAHDVNDEKLGKKHALKFINILNPDATLNENGGEFKGLDRFSARQMIIERLKQQELIEKIEDYELSAGHCYRCHTMIEPYLSRQWFVKMEPLARPAIQAVKSGQIEFVPDRFKKVYLNWMENIHDWCISRQIWWGHRLPIYYCQDCPSKPIVSVEQPKQCEQCKGSNIIQDEDVLDTWFSSWLWPFATFGWPEQNEDIKKDLEYFYPTNVLVTAPEIIFFWVARMIMAGFEFMNEKPFSKVFIHGTVRDIEGRKMSKSLGNIIDPLEIIDSYGADALRFSLVSITASGQDVFLSEEKFQMGRNFTNKIWNACRFILLNLIDQPLPEIKKEQLNVYERWILSRLSKLAKHVDESLGSFNFNDCAKSIYEFFWHEYCDWFLEIVKDEVIGKDPKSQGVAIFALKESLKILHPFMPFISQEIYSIFAPETQLVNERYPAVDDYADEQSEGLVSLLIRVITMARNLRQEAGFASNEALDELLVSVSKRPDYEFLKSSSSKIQKLLKAGRVEVGLQIKRPEQSLAHVEADISVYLPCSKDAITRLKDRLEKEISTLKSSLSGLSGRLRNKEFLKKAPADIVSGQKEKLEAGKQTLKRKQEIYDGLC